MMRLKASQADDTELDLHHERGGRPTTRRSPGNHRQGDRTILRSQSRSTGDLAVDLIWQQFQEGMSYIPCPASLQLRSRT